MYPYLISVINHSDLRSLANAGRSIHVPSNLRVGSFPSRSLVNCVRSS